MSRRHARSDAVGEPLLRIADIVRLLQVSPGTVYRLVQQGELPGVRVGGQWRFRRIDCECWLRERPRPARPGRTE